MMCGIDEYLEEMIIGAHKLASLGFCHGSTGNISLRTDIGLFVSSSGSSLGTLSSDDVTQTDEDGRIIRGRKPTKEMPFHLAIYRSDGNAAAIVHLHTVFSGIVSCMGSSWIERIPYYTPYLTMKVGVVGYIPYYKPGSPELGISMAALPQCNAYILANHGMVVKGASMKEAIDRAEELEYSLEIAWNLRNEPAELLTAEDLEELRR